MSRFPSDKPNVAASPRVAIPPRTQYVQNATPFSEDSTKSEEQLRLLWRDRNYNAPEKPK